MEITACPKPLPVCIEKLARPPEFLSSLIRGQPKTSTPWIELPSCLSGITQQWAQVGNMHLSIASGSAFFRNLDHGSVFGQIILN